MAPAKALLGKRAPGLLLSSSSNQTTWRWCRLFEQWWVMLCMIHAAQPGHQRVLIGCSTDGAVSSIERTSSTSHRASAYITEQGVNRPSVEGKNLPDSLRRNAWKLIARSSDFSRMPRRFSSQWGLLFFCFHDFSVRQTSCMMNAHKRCHSGHWMRFIIAHLIRTKSKTNWPKNQPCAVQE